MESLFINDDLPHHTAVMGHLTQPSHDDPYRYQHGFNNHHSSEAFAGALPRNGTNIPQQHPYGLYAEHLNGTPFVSSRESVSNVWMYRVRPSVAHRSLRPCIADTEVESCFLPTNPDVDFMPLTHTWGPLRDPSTSPPTSPSHNGSQEGPRYTSQPFSNAIPSHNTPAKSTTFLTGLHTLAGNGDPTLKSGLAVHQYAFTGDMTRQALTNHDGELLLIPHQGTLDVQTELGYLRVPPGSIAVLPAGIRFSVALASFPGTASGYALEIFGTRFALPELGPLGGNALAHVRDFMYPVASFDLDFDTPLPPHAERAEPGDWEIVTKLAGKFHSYTQPHTPFDVVAWHGRYAPYKYDLARFGHLTANVDQLDPTAYSVLTVPSPSSTPSHPVSLVDLCVFGEKWAVARNTLRIPYHHRTVATEMMGILRGTYGGSTRRLEAGGMSFEQAYMGHGETYECWKAQGERGPLGPEVVGRGALSFMFHVPGHVALTRFARERHPDIRLEDPSIWTTLRAPFIEKLSEASRALERMRIADEAAIQAELTALAFEVMANKRRLSSVCVTDDEGDEGKLVWSKA
ncbi:unnamed protein product [Discula destructiva]